MHIKHFYFRVVFAVDDLLCKGSDGYFNCPLGSDINQVRRIAQVSKFRGRAGPINQLNGLSRLLSKNLEVAVVFDKKTSGVLPCLLNGSFPSWQNGVGLHAWSGPRPICKTSDAGKRYYSACFIRSAGCVPGFCG